MWVLNIVLSSFLKWSWIAARNNILHLWQCLEMTSVSLLLTHPFRHIQTTGELTSCTMCKKKILEDVGYWLEGTQGLPATKEGSSLPFFLRSRAVQKDLTFTSCYTHLGHPPEASWWCTHEDKMSGCCIHEVWTCSSWRAQDFLPTWKLPWTSGQHKEWI